MSRKMKKEFSCGHKGFGKYCHECVRQMREKYKNKESNEKFPNNLTISKEEYNKIRIKIVEKTKIKKRLETKT